MAAGHQRGLQLHSHRHDAQAGSRASAHARARVHAADAEREEPELTWWGLDCAEPGALGENEFDAAIDKARVRASSSVMSLKRFA